jgi:hypothetical protein
MVVINGDGQLAVRRERQVERLSAEDGPVERSVGKTPDSLPFDGIPENQVGSV